MDDVISFWKDVLVPKDLIYRDINIPLNSRSIVVITGVRRAGKTYIMYQLIKELMDSGVDEEKIFYINFDDERIEPRKEYLTELIPTIRERYMSSSDIYLFLDEIQRIEGWDLWLNRQHARGLKIFISGSTSQLEPDKIPRSLRGRTETYIIYPLSFREFLKFRNYTEAQIDRIRSTERIAEILHYLLEYLRYGGFPEVVLIRDSYRKIIKLHEYFRAIMYRDIIEANNIDNEVLMEMILKHIMNSTYFSSTKLYNTLKSIGLKTSKNTIINYKKAVEKAYMIKQVPIFSYKIKDQNQYSKKVYCIDHGLRRSISIAYRESESKSLENLVFIELQRRMSLQSEIYYWKSGRAYEVDFVLLKNLKPSVLIQVTYDTSDDQTRRREERALLKAMDEFHLRKGYIINWDLDEEVEKENKKIIYLPAWKFLLSEKHISQFRNLTP